MWCTILFFIIRSIPLSVNLFRVALTFLCNQVWLEISVIWNFLYIRIWCYMCVLFSPSLTLLRYSVTCLTTRLRSPGISFLRQVFVSTRSSWPGRWWLPWGAATAHPKPPDLTSQLPGQPMWRELLQRIRWDKFWVLCYDALWAVVKMRQLLMSPWYDNVKWLWPLQIVRKCRISYCNVAGPGTTGKMRRGIRVLY